MKTPEEKNSFLSMRRSVNDWLDSLLPYIGFTSNRYSPQYGEGSSSSSDSDEDSYEWISSHIFDPWTSEFLDELLNQQKSQERKAERRKERKAIKEAKTEIETDISEDLFAPLAFHPGHIKVEIDEREFIGSLFHPFSGNLSGPRYSSLIRSDDHFDSSNPCGPDN